VQTNFSGKTFYFVNGDGYQEVLFNADGTVEASTLYTSGTPSAVSPIGTWNVSSTGTMQLVNQSGQTIVFTLTGNNTGTDYYTTAKSVIGSSGSVATGWFYNQSTALLQAQLFTASREQP